MLRLIAIFCLGMLVLFGAGALGFGALFLQDTPRLEAMAPPTSEDVAATRHLVRNLRQVTKDGEASAALLRTDAAELNSALRLGARFVEGFRGRVSLGSADVLGEVSVPVPWWNGRKWLNLSGRVPEFSAGVAFTSITVGAREVPPALALGLARIGANLALGNAFGDKVVRAASGMRVEDDGLAFRIALDEVGKNGVMRSTFGTLRGSEMPEPEEIEAYHRLIRTAMENGTLRQTGSFLPYLRFTLQAVAERSTPETRANAYTAAVFGLAKACGARDFSMIVGRLAFDAADFATREATDCSEVTFNGRIDSRRHFITSAALQAASNTGVAVSVGEFKELYDAISGAGGFDFTDLAANLSGIRMSNAFMRAPPADWPTLLSRLEREGDVIVPFEGIPQIMTQAEFKARFGDVDSPAYGAMLAQIESQIDLLRLHQPGGARLAD